MSLSDAFPLAFGDSGRVWGGGVWYTIYMYYVVQIVPCISSSTL